MTRARTPTRQRADGLRARLELCRRWRGLDTPRSYSEREGMPRQAVCDLLRLIRRILEIPHRRRVDLYWLTSVYLEKYEPLLEIQESQDRDRIGLGHQDLQLEDQDPT